MLSNVFLHYVLDLWFEQEVKPRLKHRAFLIRFADDFVIGFRDDRDAQRVMEVCAEAIRQVRSDSPSHQDEAGAFPSAVIDDEGPGRATSDRPGTFDLLGFTHYWGRSRRGHWVVKLKTASDRFSRAVRSIDSWCRANRHLPIREQQQKLNEKLRGHYAYYGVTGNSAALSRFLHEVERRWRKWLRRRNRLRSLNWSVFRRLLQRFPLAPVRTVHSVYRHAANP